MKNYSCILEFAADWVFFAQFIKGRTFFAEGQIKNASQSFIVFFDFIDFFNSGPDNMLLRKAGRLELDLGDCRRRQKVVNRMLLFQTKMFA